MMMEIFPGGASRLEFHRLANWLMERARSSNINQALDDLETYLRATNLPFQVTVAVSGLKVFAVCDLGRGISFVPWDALQDSNQKKSVWERCFMGVSLNLPTGALVRDFSITKLHVHQDEFETQRPIAMKPIDDTEIHDALMCMALVGPFAHHAVASWISPPRWMPISGGGIGLSYIEGSFPSQSFPEEKCLAASSLFEKFCSLTVDLQARLRLAMQRLYRAMRRGVPVDAAIDLGIALEVLYLDSKDRGELTFRLKIRAALLLGTDEADKKRIFKLVDDLYRLRSSAVHEGKVAPDIRGRPTKEVLSEGYSIAAETARRFITDQEPNWEKVMFG
ncbi:MAG: hypothetical protein ABI988_14420 [Nitrospirota bacterium]